MLQLVRPAPENLDSYCEACAETSGHLHNAYILHDPRRSGEWRRTIFRRFREEERGIGLPEGFVPSATFWLVDPEGYVGTVNIRLRLNAALADYGGHIGLAIRLSRRGHGLARTGFRLAIGRAKEMGIDPVLITCVESNLPSLRALLGIPCRDMESAVTEADGVLAPVRRFRY